MEDNVPVVRYVNTPIPQNEIGAVRYSSGLCNNLKTLASIIRFYPNSFATVSPELNFIFPKLKRVDIVNV